MAPRDIAMRKVFAEQYKINLQQINSKIQNEELKKYRGQQGADNLLAKWREKVFHELVLSIHFCRF